jgi:hypothetical protein
VQRAAGPQVLLAGQLRIDHRLADGPGTEHLALQDLDSVRGNTQGAVRAGRR